MLDDIEIVLKPNVGEAPLPYLKIEVCGHKIYEDIGWPDKYSLKSTLPLAEENRLNITIHKTGKTKKVVDSGEPQEIIIEEVLLNGMSQHPDKFGTFMQKDNPYVKDDLLKGNHLALNGIWELDVPIFRQKFLPDMAQPYRDTFEDTKIACFGCSFTFGSELEYDQTWPYFIGKDAKNYGMGGSSISSIVGTARAYLEDHSCEKMIILLPHPCRLQLEDKDGTVHTLLPGRSPDVENKFKDINRDIVIFGEGSLLLSGYANSLKENLKAISDKTDLYLSSYTPETYDCLPSLNEDYPGNVIGAKFKILPFYEMSGEYEMASDKEHPGPDHNRAFTKQITPILGG